MRYSTHILATVAILAGANGVSWAVDDAPISPAVKAAVGELASSDTAAREKASRVIETHMVAQLSALLNLQDAESSDRAAEVLAHHAAVSAYLREVLGRPAEKRADALKWLFTGDHLSLLSAALSSRTEDKLSAARRLANENGDEADALLSRLLSDRDWDVSGAAIDASSKRPAGPAVIDALWNRCVLMPQQMNRRRIEQPKQLRFRGKVLPMTSYDYAYNDGSVDNAATEALVALKSPLVEKKLIEALEQYNRQPNENMALFQPYYGGGQSFMTLMSEYKPKRAVPILMASLTTNETYKQSGAGGGGAFYWSSRTMPMVMIAKITDQDPADYQLSRRRDFGNNQWASPSEKDQRAAEVKMREWYEAHKSEYVATTPTTNAAPSTVPASQPAVTPAVTTGSAPTRK